MSIKMKGLLKGLRYISQIFEEEEENDMQIGFPTDVKHVAHIGWDGPSVNSPSWMNEFKSTPPGNVSANGDINNRDVDDIEWVSQDLTTKKCVKDPSGRGLPALPKSSRRQPSVDSIGSIDYPVGSSTQKNKSSRRRSKQKESTNSPRGDETSNSQDLRNIPKKSRRKKSKDNGDDSVKSSSSSKSKAKGSRHGSRHGSNDGSITKQYSGEISGSGLVSLKEQAVKE